MQQRRKGLSLIQDQLSGELFDLQSYKGTHKPHRNPIPDEIKCIHTQNSNLPNILCIPHNSDVMCFDALGSNQQIFVE